MLLMNWVLTLRDIHKSTETQRKYLEVKLKHTCLQKSIVISLFWVYFLTFHQTQVSEANLLYVSHSPSDSSMSTEGCPGLIHPEQQYKQTAQ